MYPVMISLGNITTEDRHKPASKAVVAFLPVVKKLDDQDRLAYHTALHEFWRILLEPLRLHEHTIFSYVDCDGRYCAAVVRLALFIADQPEAATLTGTSGTHNTAQACGLCHCPTTEFHNVEGTIHGQYAMRTEAEALANLGNAEALKRNRCAWIKDKWVVGSCSLRQI